LEALPEGMPSPRELLERARAPDAARPEVDALLRGLALPLAPGEDARARADLLHDILEDKRVRAFMGSKGRRVAHAAVEALVALGYPYALEVPPELLAEFRLAPPVGAEAPSAAWMRGLAAIVGGLVGTSGLFVMGSAFAAFIANRRDGGSTLLFGLALVSGSIFVGVAWVLLGLARRPRTPEGEQED
jgi:hypothetical protein